MEGLNSIRDTAARWFLAYLWLHVPVVAITAWAVGTGILWPTVMAALLCVASTLVFMLQRDGAAARNTISVALALMPAVLVYTLTGHPWQIDMHMYFFAAIAMVTVFCDWRCILLAAGTIAVHHLLLNYLLPAAVFPDGTSLARVVLHAVIVVIESVALMWLAERLVRLFATAEAAVAQAQAAQREVEMASEAKLQADAQAKAEKAELLSRLADEFDRTIGQVIATLSQQVENLDRTAAAMLEIAGETSSGATRLTGSAQAASNDVEAVASAAEELRASIREISGQATMSESTTRKVLDGAQGASDTVRELANALSDIGSVVTLIQDIAEQTNLLALNATIEAARAGEAGKGFAVVANEVKNLASQTAKATDDITRRISHIQSQSDLAVGSIEHVGKSMSGLSEAAASICAAIEEQTAATAEIARSADLASGNVASATEEAARVDQSSGRARSSAQDLAHSAEGLRTENGNLRSMVESFLAQVRAA